MAMCIFDGRLVEDGVVPPLPRVVVAVVVVVVVVVPLFKAAAEERFVNRFLISLSNSLETSRVDIRSVGDAAAPDEADDSSGIVPPLCRLRGAPLGVFA